MTESNRPKAMLRTELLANRQSISAEVRRNWDAAIGTALKNWLGSRRIRALGVYWPIRSEPDLRSIYEELAANGMRLALPMVKAKDAPLVFLAWTPGDPLARDSYGVMVPQAAEEIAPDALLVPCVGFNNGNYRLGYGGGFYDRTLAKTPRPEAVGIAYECGRARFEAEAFDVPLDVVITERSDGRQPG